MSSMKMMTMLGGRTSTAAATAPASEKAIESTKNKYRNLYFIFLSVRANKKPAPRHCLPRGRLKSTKTKKPTVVGRLDQTLPHRPHRRLGAVTDGDLAEDVLHVLLHGLDADRERAADFLVAQSQCHVPK